MKNKFVKYILSVAVASCMTGCFDLDHEEFYNIDADGFPKSEAELDASIVGVYNTLADSYIQSGMDNYGAILNMLPTDEMNTSWEHTWRQQDRFLWTANDCTAPENVYFKYQRGVTKATRIIDALEKADIAEAKKKRGMAELRVLRVLYMQLLHSLFGPVPVVIDPKVANDVSVEWKPSRPTEDEMLSYMVKEIEESYRDLAVVPSAADWGHFTQGAALTLLMKIYMGAKQFDKVNQVADEIIGLGTYELLPDYKAVFDINNEGVTHKEAIFVIGQTTSNAKYAWTWFACVMPSSPLYAGTYLKTIWGGLKMPWTFYDKYEEQDKRLETIVRYYTDTDGNKVDYRQVDHPKATGAAPMKYSEDPEQKGERQSNDFIMFRYADVLLAKAEAMNELNGPSEEAIEWVNQIRRRANATEIKLVDFNKDTFRDFILDERGRELYCEGHRRDDLIRHGKYIEYARKDGMDAKDYHILFPIPQKALNENSNLKQNPGYEN